MSRPNSGPPAAARHAEHAQAARSHGFRLVPTSRGRIWTSSHFVSRSGFRATTKRLGLGNRRIHDLRHTAASSLLLPGADLKAVQGILGHASATRTADLYGHLMDGPAWRAMEALDQAPPAGSAGQTPATDLPS